MQLPDTIELQLKAKHFESAVWDDVTNCPIAHAANEQLIFPVYKFHAYVKYCWMLQDEEQAKSITYYYDFAYHESGFQKDKTAAANQPPETIIRTITLTRQS